MNVSSTLKKAQAGGKTKPTYEQLVEALAESEEFASEANALGNRVVKINEEQTQHISKAEARIRVLESEKREDREKIETLKAMLRASEIEAAHTRGYLERVSEDDDVRDAVPQTSVSEETHMVTPRRRRNYAGTMPADYDPGPGYANPFSASAKADTAGLRNGRPATWRDKSWGEW